MSSLLVSITAQIAALDAQLISISPTSVSANGISETNTDWVKLSDQRMKLEMILNRINGSSPMIVRGSLRGMR